MRNTRPTVGCCALLTGVAVADGRLLVDRVAERPDSVAGRATTRVAEPLDGRCDWSLDDSASRSGVSFVVPLALTDESSGQSMFSSFGVVVGVDAELLLRSVRFFFDLASGTSYVNLSGGFVVLRALPSSGVGFFVESAILLYQWFNH